MHDLRSRDNVPLEQGDHGGKGVLAMSVKLKNVSRRDVDVDDGMGGRLTIPAGATKTFHTEVASDDVRELLAARVLEIVDAPDDEDEDC